MKRYNENGMNQKNTSVLFEDKALSLSKDNQEAMKQIAKITLKVSKENYQKPILLRIQNEAYRFYRLSDFMIDENLKIKLLSLDRYHTCHHQAIDFLMQNENYPIVTGYIYIQGKRQLHSVNKTIFLREEVYLDFTGNIIMPIQDYKRLFQFQILEEVSQKEYYENTLIMGKVFETMKEKMILTFLKEISLDLKNRNSNLFR